MISLNEKEITQIYRDDSLVEYIYKGDRPIYDCMIDYVLNDVNETCYVNRAGSTPVARQENIEYLYIPNKICKNSRIYKVTKVGNYGGYHNKFQTLKKALIGTPTDESGNMAIVDHGFEGRTSLEEVVITDSVVFIGFSAFWGCNKIAKMTLPPCVSRFDQIFGNQIDESTGEWVPKSLKTVTIHSNWKIYRGLMDRFFYKCSYIETINIDIKNFESIGDNAFEGCSNLKIITIPNSVTSIGEDAFKGCDNLQYNEYDNGYYLGNSNNSYVALIKAKDTLISSCIINENTKIIYSDAFGGCSGLTDITIPNSVTSIGNSAFLGCSGLTSVIIGNSVASIGNSAFNNCSGLVGELKIPDSVISIGRQAFYYCSGLTSVKIGNSVTSIGDFAFYKCSGLTSVTIPDSVTSIGERAFYNCKGLTSVTIGNSVASIGDYAFYYCSGLVGELKIPNSVTFIGEAAFQDCRGLTSVTIGNSVTSIGDFAFYYCSGLTSVTISGSVISIGEWAFSDCKGLKSVTIPDSVTSIGDFAFYYCSGLTSVKIGNSVTSIGSWAFGSCSGLTNVTMLPTNPPTLGSDVIPSNVTTITVPVGCGNTYKTAAGWSAYADKIVEATA